MTGALSLSSATCRDLLKVVWLHFFGLTSNHISCPSLAEEWWKRSPVGRVHQNPSVVYAFCLHHCEGYDSLTSKRSYQISTEHCCYSSDFVFFGITALRSPVPSLYHQELFLSSRAIKYLWSNPTVYFLDEDLPNLLSLSKKKWRAKCDN